MKRHFVIPRGIAPLLPDPKSGVMTIIRWDCR